MVLRLAHEVRNPLATIKTGVQLIRHLLKPQDEVITYFESVLKEVTRIDRIIRDMQRFVRLDAHTAWAIAPNNILPGAVDSCREAARAAGVHLEFLPGPPVRVMLDPEQLSFAAAELTGNAIRHSPQGCTVTVRLLNDLEGRVLIQVDDQGKGISLENASRICRPFYSTSTHGTGLGLAIVSRICQLYQGRLEWQNRPEGGCRFTIVLPGLPAATP